MILQFLEIQPKVLEYLHLVCVEELLSGIVIRTIEARPIFEINSSNEPEISITLRFSLILGKIVEFNLYSMINLLIELLKYPSISKVRKCYVWDVALH